MHDHDYNNPNCSVKNMHVYLVISFIGHYLIGVWLGEDQKTNIKETRVFGEVVLRLHILLTSPHSIVIHKWDDLCIVNKSTNMHFR